MEDVASFTGACRQFLLRMARVQILHSFRAESRQ